MIFRMKVVELGLRLINTVEYSFPQDDLGTKEPGFLGLIGQFLQ